MADGNTLTELQLAILSVLWDRAEATSAEVRQDLEPFRALALTTITTLLGRLEKKGVVAHRRDGRRYLYRATVSRNEVRRTMIDSLTDSLFDGSRSALVHHVLVNNPPEGSDLDRIRGALLQDQPGDGPTLAN